MEDLASTRICCCRKFTAYRDDTSWPEFRLMLSVSIPLPRRTHWKKDCNYDMIECAIRRVTKPSDRLKRKRKQRTHDAAKVAGDHENILKEKY